MPKTNLVVDGHVHYYDCYDFDKFFDAAIKNMDNMSISTYSGDNNFQKVLLFTEGKDNDYFSRFKTNCNLNKQSEYEFKNTQEDCSIILLKNGQPICHILAGRQIVTREKLEVLSIASNQKIEDGLPIKDVVKRLIDNKQIAVLAWGVGKWLLKRGKIIKDIIKKYHSPYLFIGDSSARPSFWPTPKLYKLARKNNIGNISGSDPLPFIEDQSRVGTYGFLIEGDFQPSKPAESFRNILISNKSNIALFGHQDSTFTFLRRQTKNFFL
jgi:hypothetical protein